MKIVPRCATCSPPVFALFPDRIDETHVGTRFGDQGDVIINGGPLNAFRVVEAIASHGLAIIVHDAPADDPHGTHGDAKHTCPTSNPPHFCTRLLTGADIRLMNVRRRRSTLDASSRTIPAS